MYSFIHFDLVTSSVFPLTAPFGHVSLPYSVTIPNVRPVPSDAHVLAHHPDVFDLHSREVPFNDLLVYPGLTIEQRAD